MTQDTRTAEREATDRATETTAAAGSKAKRAVSTLRGRTGLLTLLGGGLLTLRAVRTARRSGGWGRAAVQGLAGVALLGFGLRRRRSAGAPDVDPGGSASERADSQQPDSNPRGTSGEPDVETKTGPDEGDVQFTDDQTDEPRAKPDLDEESPDDPRRDTREDDEAVEVDLSEASMADEASEATGPSTEQAFPAKEGTDPEPNSPEADPEENAETEGEDEDEVETEGGASVKTDTVEAGTMKMDEEDVTESEKGEDERPESEEAQDRTGAAYGDEPGRTEEDVDET